MIIGQTKTIEIVNKELAAASKLRQVPKSMLFFGEPGLGKSFMIDLVAGSNVFDRRIDTYATTLTTIKMKALLRLPSNNPGLSYALVVDEVHGLDLNTAEMLYSIMLENKYFDGYRNRDVKITVLGATTNPELMPRAMFDRFFYHFRLDYYSIRDLGAIVYQKYGNKIDVPAINEIAKRGRGVPRYTLQYADMVYKCAVVKGKAQAGIDEASEAFTLLEIDNLGLNRADREYLRYLDQQGAPVGLAAIAMALSTPVKNVEYLIEPYLLRLGLIQRTSRGRVLGNHPHLETVL